VHVQDQMIDPHWGDRTTSFGLRDVITSRIFSVWPVLCSQDVSLADHSGIYPSDCCAAETCVLSALLASTA